MKSFYSIQELADILETNIYSVADGLAACGVTPYCDGRKANISDWRRPISVRGNEIFVTTGIAIEPNPDTVVVSTEALPLLWVQNIKDATSALARADGQDKNHKQWPWGNRETELLRKLASAAEKLWSLYDPIDPTTAPTKKQVIDWLKNEGVSRRVAEVMAQILRDEKLPSGPRKS